MQDINVSTRFCRCPSMPVALKSQQINRKYAAAAALEDPAV